MFRKTKKSTAVDVDEKKKKDWEEEITRLESNAKWWSGADRREEEKKASREESRIIQAFEAREEADRRSRESKAIELEFAEKNRDILAQAAQKARNAIVKKTRDLTKAQEAYAKLIRQGAKLVDQEENATNLPWLLPAQQEIDVSSQTQSVYGWPSAAYYPSRPSAAPPRDEEFTQRVHLQPQVAALSALSAEHEEHETDLRRAAGRSLDSFDLGASRGSLEDRELRALGEQIEKIVKYYAQQKQKQTDVVSIIDHHRRPSSPDGVDLLVSGGRIDPSGFWEWDMSSKSKSTWIPLEHVWEVLKMNNQHITLMRYINTFIHKNQRDAAPARKFILLKSAARLEEFLRFV